MGERYLDARWPQDRAVIEAGVLEAEATLEDHREHLALRIERRIGQMLDNSL
jgi:hypothetical protein